jgi:hypothetical protein
VLILPDSVAGEPIVVTDSIVNIEVWRVRRRRFPGNPQPADFNGMSMISAFHLFFFRGFGDGFGSCLTVFSKSASTARG